jgi:acyl-[acyl-carrier-protein]-phospholipid O-acyltransferase/long-chain-fatty-acid--[acyl-carrier-protein] ligase
MTRAGGDLPANHPAAPWRRGFWSLIVTQFQNAFNDQAYQNLLTFLIIGMGLSEATRERLVSEVAALFAVPFILFSMTGGWLADRFSKRTVMVGTKLLEAAVMVIALIGLARGDLRLEILAVFLMATQSALFGPSKYGLLPELLPEKRLSWGNGVLELGTFIGILGGIICGPLLAQYFRGRQQYSGVLLFTLSVIGLVTALGITRVPAAAPKKQFRVNFLGDLWRQIQVARRDRVLWLAILGNTYFFFLATLLKMDIIFYGADLLKLDEIHIGYMAAAIAVGIGVGSLVAGYLSGGRIEYGLIPMGALGLTSFAFALGAHSLSFHQVLLRLALLGFFGGFFIVPINAMIQHRPDETDKGGIIASANLLSFGGVFIAAATYYLLKTVLAFDPRQIFIASAALTVVSTGYVLYILPDAFLRLLLWLLTHSVYRIKVVGRDNIPEKGGALFVANHMSFVDALLLIASTDRPIRFVMFKDIYEHPLVKPGAKIMQAIPISSQLRPREMIRALRTASEAIQNGEVVCIFAEGQITRIGHLLPFRRGFERIMKGVDAPIVPVHLDGVWGSIFSYERGRFLWKLPRHVPYPVTVSFGTPMPATSTPFEVRQAVMELGTEAYPQHKKRLRPLHRALLKTARRHPMRFAMADGRVPRVNWGPALMKTVFLARRLRKIWAGQEMVGVLLPPSVAGALVNYAAMLMGKVAVNLNYTASNEVLASCAQQCNLKTIITSQAFLEKLPHLQPPGEVITLEKLAENPRASEKIAALLMSWLLPARLLERVLGRTKRAQLDDLATIIFSSGSTGDPKGVMLSHYNIASNIEQVGQTFMLDRHDRVLGILPFFHSFGFMATLWMPAMLGVGAVYHPSPLDARAIGALVQQYRVTLMVATPTFIQAYARRCSPENFGSLEFVLVGAEKLPERVAQAFEDAFGIKPLEGYGCTECAPVVAVNTKDFRAAGFRQVGAKRGRIGHPVPGVSVRIVSPETGEPTPLGQPGLLLVRGPNIMLGYLGHPEKTAEVLVHGWYNTGDIASQDEDGFLTIADRLSRFSKIGGEMVPHLKIEDKLHELADAAEQTFAVTAVPDEKKGERIVVLHTLSDERLKPVLERFAASELPALWKPRPQQFLRVEALPYLGTGKLDLRKMKEIAATMIEQKGAAV